MARGVRAARIVGGDRLDVLGACKGKNARVCVRVVALDVVSEAEGNSLVGSEVSVVLVGELLNQRDLPFCDSGVVRELERINVGLCGLQDRHQRASINDGQQRLTHLPRNAKQDPEARLC